MTSYQTRTFQHNGKDYEIRIASDGHTFHVRVFVDGRPANGYTYSVEVLTQIDAAAIGSGIDLLETLIKTAEQDVRNGTWEQYVSAVNATDGNP